MEDDEGENVVDLLGHCAFCRRELTEEKGIVAVAGESGFENEEAVRIVPKAVGEESEFSSFTHVWGYLLGSRERRSLSVKYTFFNSSGGGDGEGMIPPMCQYCGDTVNQLDKLHKELMRKVEKIKRIVEESSTNGSYSWRDEELQRKLGSALLKPEVKNRTCQFLGNLLKSSSDNFEGPDLPFFDDDLLSNLDDLTDLNCNKPRRPVRSTRFAAKQQEKNRRSAKNEVKTSEHENEGSQEEPTTTSEDIVKQEVYSPPPTPSAYYSEESDEDTGNNANTQLTPRRGSGSDYEIEDEEEDESSEDEGEEVNSSDSEYSPKKLKPSQKRMTKTRRGRRRKGGIGQASNNVTIKMEEEGEEEEAEEELPQEEENDDSDNPAERQLAKLIRRKREKIPFTCGDCSETFAKESELVDHKMVVHGVEEPFACQECGKSFLRLKSLSNHEKLHSGIRPHKCDYPNCNLRYITRHGLAKHKRTIHNAKRPVCDICGKDFHDGSSLRQHVNSKHLGIRHQCPVCAHLFARSSGLKAHMLVHTKADMDEAKLFQICPVCPSGKNKYKVGEEITTHLKEAHDQEELVKCKQCPHVFPNRVDLLEHLHKHRSEGILCDLCDNGVRFDRHCKFRHHYFIVHRIGQKHICEDCGKGFSTATSLNTHRQGAHSGVENKIAPHKCDVCEEAYKTEGALLTHKIRGHGAEPLKCDDCDKTFDRVRSLEDHRKLHLGVLDFMCDVEGCERGYPTSHSLSKHKREVHRTGRSVCDTCGKSFYNSKGLEKHVQTVHLKMGHVCHICGAKLASLRSYRHHMAIHNGDQPFRCHICNRGFCQRRKMVAHVRVKHETEPQEKKPRVGKPSQLHICETCGKAFKALYRLNRHALIHSGERPHICPYCEQPFRLQQSLAAHVKLHETKGDRFKPKGSLEFQAAQKEEKKSKAKKKPAGYPCEACDEVFTAEKEFANHLISVHGESPFRCEFCEKSFTRRQTLEDHEKLHTGVKDHVCNVPGCGMSYASSHSLGKHKRKVHRILAGRKKKAK